MPKCRDNRRARLRRRKREQRRLSSGTIFHFPDGTKIRFKPSEMYISKFEPVGMELNPVSGFMEEIVEVTLTKRGE